MMDLKCKYFLLRLSFIVCIAYGQVIDEDDAIIVDADGPGPSILGSVDNVFKAIKDFDQFRCLEKMLCEYMQVEGDTASALLSQPFQALTTSSNSPTSPQFGTPTPTRFSSSHHQTQFGHHRPHSVPPPQEPSLIDEISSLVFGKRRSGNFRRRFRRQATSSTQGNIIRLFQATGMDTLNLFPYVRAALIGHATRHELKHVSNIRRGSTSCNRMYRECPNRSGDLLDYMNNHNGGFFNQVQPSVNQEVGPIISAIVSDTLGSSSSQNQPQQAAASEGSLFGLADSVFTNAIIQGATSYLTQGNNPGTAASTTGSNSGLGGLLGGLIGGSESSSAGGIGNIMNSVSNLFGGKKRRK